MSLFHPQIAPLPAGPFRVIAADPPWRFAVYSETGKGRSPDGPAQIVQRERPPPPVPLFDLDDALDPDDVWDDDPMSNSPARHYETMPLEDIMAMPVQSVAADDCLLLMWVVDSMLPEALEVGRAWGFQYKTVGFYWAKERRETSSRRRPDDVGTDRFNEPLTIPEGVAC